MQNLSREPIFGVDIRSKFIAAPGKKFVICDLAQIEPRCTAYVTGDEGMLHNMRKGYAIYEAFAKSTGVWDGEPGTLKATDKDLYALCKAQVLALGYGCGAEKFIYMAKLYAGLTLELAEAQAIVSDYRRRNPHITNMWKRLASDVMSSWTVDYTPGNVNFVGEHWITLPSRRKLYYRGKVIFSGKTHYCEEEEIQEIILLWQPGYFGHPTRIWGGNIFENVIQATARDVLMEGILRLEASGIPVIFSAHDEVVCEVDEDFDGNEVKSLMTIAPEWAPNLPLDAEFVESKHYLK